MFETKDPNINIDLHGLEHKGSNKLTLKLTVSRVSEKNVITSYSIHYTKLYDKLTLKLTVSRVSEKNAHAFKKNSKFWLGKDTNA